MLTHTVDKSHLDSRDFGSDFLCPNIQNGVCVTVLGNTNVHRALGNTNVQTALGKTKVHRALGNTNVQAALVNNNVHRALGNTKCSDRFC